MARPSLTARMADQLDRMAFALDALDAVTPRPPDLDPADPKPLTPSAQRLRAEALALVAEYRTRRR